LGNSRIVFYLLLKVQRAYVLGKTYLMIPLLGKYNSDEKASLTHRPPFLPQ
jgi:hypothetical protein